MSLFSLDDKKVRTPPAGKFWIAHNATVVGAVTLQEDVSIWFNAVLRGDNEPIHIGARTNIQEGTVLHTDPGFPLIVEEDCTIGHMAMLHGCTIGAGTLIGIGAIVLNGAKIGAGSLIGAGALVGEGKEIPPGSLVVGAPGKVLRQLTEKDQARVRQGAEAYVKKGRHYAAALKPQS